MKTALQQIEHLGRFERLQLVEDFWDEFASETDPETQTAVLDELERRAAWRDAHPGQSKSLAQIAQSLGMTNAFPSWPACTIVAVRPGGREIDQ